MIPTEVWLHQTNPADINTDTNVIDFENEAQTPQT